jgi:hypothetical protein
LIEVINDRRWLPLLLLAALMMAAVMTATQSSWFQVTEIPGGLPRTGQWRDWDPALVIRKQANDARRGSQINNKRKCVISSFQI